MYINRLQVVFNNALRGQDVALRPERLQEFYGALKAFNAYCYTSENLLNLSVEDGDLILLDNHRILHGATALQSCQIEETVTTWDVDKFLLARYTDEN